MAPAAKPIPEGFHTVTPQLVCRGAERALEFYKNAFGAEILSVSKDDKQNIMNAQIKIGDSIVMVVDEFPQWHCLSPLSLNGTPVTLHIYTTDADAAFAKAVAAGAEVKMPPMDAFWGDRYGQVSDPFGHFWSIATRTHDFTQEEMQAAAQKAFAEMAKHQTAGN
jgi:PhnB protein